MRKDGVHALLHKHTVRILAHCDYPNEYYSLKAHSGPLQSNVVHCCPNVSVLFPHPTAGFERLLLQEEQSNLITMKKVIHRIMLGACAGLLLILKGTAGAAPVVAQPLPPALEGPASGQPSPDHQWVPGHWYAVKDGYCWAAGHWDLPPGPGAAWIPAQWVASNGGYVLSEGGWQTPQIAQSEAVPQEVIVEAAPPPPQTEVITAPPSPFHVWIAGYWGWRDGRHVWIAGRWERPPREHMVWEAPRWEVRGGRHVLVEGRWHEPGVSVAASVSLGPIDLVIRTGPPAPRREVIDERSRPSREHVWIAGYWAWRGGTHVWIGGHWERPPRRGAVWEPGRYDPRNGGFVFIEGRWR